MQSTKFIKHFLLSFLLFITVVADAQVGIGTATPAASAQLDISSTTKGFLPPRMTTAERNLIVTPAAGLIVFNSSNNAIEMYTGSKWISMGSSTADALPTIQIGTQKWQSKNLDVAFYRNGDPIPQVTDPTAWANLTTGAWCYYNNDSTLGTKYGKLYNWYAVNDPRGLAPTGWHIPTEAEWMTVSTTLGGFSVAGGKMKEAGTLNWTSPNTGGNNNSGFTGLPGGGRANVGAFFDVSNLGGWWSSTVFDTAFAFLFFLSFDDSGVGGNNFYKQIGLSVRCLRD
jgi:uncharacterized protein (TIGR02145 family)